MGHLYCLVRPAQSWSRLTSLGIAVTAVTFRGCGYGVEAILGLVGVICQVGCDPALGGPVAGIVYVGDGTVNCCYIACDRAVALSVGGARIVQGARAIGGLKHRSTCKLANRHEFIA